MFEGGATPAGGPPSEGVFSDFVQYQEGGGEGPHLGGPEEAQPCHRTSRRGPGPAKPQDKPVMQSCLEHF